MKKPMSTRSLFDILSEVRGTKLTKIAQIDRVIDWAPVRAVIGTVHTTGSTPTGRPSYDGLMLFKIELLRVWYGLRDEGVEEMVNDRISFSRFVGLSLAAPAPDSTTVLRFRRAMAEAGALDQALREINRQLEAQGLVVKSGAIIGASVTDSPRRPRGRKEYEAVDDRREEEGGEAAAAAMLREVPKPNVDGEARWIRKAGQLRFGYKRHTVTDPNGMILAEETTAANASDTRHFEGPLRRAGLPRGIPIYADKGYASAENRAAVRRMGCKDRIMRRAARGKGLSAREQQLNAGISRTRCRVERTFGAMRRWFHGGTARYVGLAKTHAQHVMEAIAHNLYRAPGLIVANA